MRTLVSQRCGMELICHHAQYFQVREDMKMSGEKIMKDKAA